jgi:hypothetical protein
MAATFESRARVRYGWTGLVQDVVVLSFATREEQSAKRVGRPCDLPEDATHRITVKTKRSRR